MNKLYIFIVIAVVLMAGAGFYFAFNGGSEKKVDQDASLVSSNSDAPQKENELNKIQEPTDDTNKETSQTKEFTVVGTSNMKFSLNEIKVKKGDKVRIVFKNEGGFHDWVIDEFNAKTKQMPAGQSETIEFTADKTGSFEYYCSVGKHRQMGMKGNLIVE